MRITNEAKESVRRFLDSPAAEAMWKEVRECDSLHHAISYTHTPPSEQEQAEQIIADFTSIKDVKAYVLRVDDEQLDLGRSPTETKQQIWKRISAKEGKIPQSRLTCAFTFNLKEQGVNVGLISSDLSESKREAATLLESHGFVPIDWRAKSIL